MCCIGLQTSYRSCSPQGHIKVIFIIQQKLISCYSFFSKEITKSLRGQIYKDIEKEKIRQKTQTSIKSLSENGNATLT